MYQVFKMPFSHLIPIEMPFNVFILKAGCCVALHPWGSAVQCRAAQSRTQLHIYADSVYTILVLILFLLTHVRF